MSAGQHRGARGLRAVHRGEHVRHLLFVDDRTESSVSPVPDLQLSVGLHEHRLEPVVDGVEHESAAAGGASLAGVAERRSDRPGHRILQVGIVAHDERVLAAELETRLREPPPGRLGDPAARLRTTR